MDVAALIISILAIIISVIVAAVQIAKNKKINDINLEAELSKEIVKVYLTEIFPKAVSDVSFKKKRLTNIAPLQKALIGLRVKLKFYIYCDNEFYQNLKRQLQDLEDYIVNNEDRYFGFDAQKEVRQIIYLKMTEIYSLLKKKYKDG